MRIIYGFDNLPPLRNPAVTVGSYDGVHAGHRELLAYAVRLAVQQEGESVVVTFAPHPRTVLGNRGETVQLLNTSEEKIFLLEQLGLDNLLIVPFTEDFSRMSAEDFVRECLVGKLGARSLVVGYNHRFGYRHAGDFSQLERLRQEFGFSICEVPKQEVGHDKVSSTAIRRLIAAGDLLQAAPLLAHPYIAILHADAAGELHTGDPHKLLPPPGDYRVRTEETERTLHIDVTGKMSLDPPVGTEKQGSVLMIFCS